VKGISFTEPMMKAWLSGNKSVTRRLCSEYINKNPSLWAYGGIAVIPDGKFRKWNGWHKFCAGEVTRYLKPRYKTGETVYIKEVWTPGYEFLSWDEGEVDEGDPRDRIEIFYMADGVSQICDAPTGTAEEYLHKYGDCDGPDDVSNKSPRFMPEWASRSHALIKSVRPERVQEINEIDAYLEGFRDQFRGEIFWSVGAQFKEIWEILHPGSWEKNPWVWRYELVKKGI